MAGRWVAAKEAGLEGAAANLSLADKEADDVEKRLPGGKVKKKTKPEIVLEVATRSKKKSVTTILGKLQLLSHTARAACYQRPAVHDAIVRAGLDTFGVKLPEASKLFGKKFASGASITKSPTDKDQIEVQGDFLDKAAELIVKTYADKGIVKKRIYFMDNKKKTHYFDDED